MEEKIAEYLVNRGYTSLSSSIAQVKVFFRVDGDLAMSVLMIDGRKMIMSVEAFRMIKAKTLEMFRNKGYSNVRLFSLLLTQNVMNFGAIGTQEELSWIVDLRDNRLCIFDNEVVDFDGLRAGLEQLLEEGGEMIRITIAGALKEFFLHSKAPVTLALILVNLIIFVTLSFKTLNFDSYFMLEHGALSLSRIMANYEWYRLLTAAFLHFNLEHLAANMLALWMFGERVEKALGKAKFLILYLVAAVMGNAVSLVVSLLSGANVVSAGASGAVFGIIGALFAIVIKNRGKYADLTGGRAIFLVLYSIFSGFAGEGIDNAAHIGGLVAGLLLGFILYRSREDNGEISRERKETPE